MKKTNEIMKIDVDTDNFREIGAKEGDMLEKELKCTLHPHDPNSFKSRYPHIFNLLISTLNQIRQQAREQAEKEGK